MRDKLLILLAACFLTSCGGNKAETAARQMAAQMSPAESRLAVSVWQQANAFRASARLKPMAANRGLTALAQEHANYLSSTGGVVIDKKQGFRVRSVRVYRDYGMNHVTEFVYLGVPEASAVLATWRADKSYLANLKTNWNQCGVGVSISPSGDAHVVMLSALKMAGARNVGPTSTF